LTFSNGAPLDSAAVKAAITRNENAPHHGQFNPTLYDVSSIDTPSPTSVVVHLSQPVAGSFYELLGGPEAFITLPGSADVNSDPIGAGPYMLQKYVPNQEILLAKNPKYWDARDIRLSEIDILNVQTGPQQVNAIESGTVNLTSIPISSAPAIRSNTGLKLIAKAAQTGSIWMPLCKSASPLNNVKVRQALSYAIDRKGINRAVLNGTGEPQWALWPSNSIYFPQSLTNSYAYNPGKAKRLLAQAGLPNGFSINLVLLPGVPVTTQVAQIVQSEWKAIGVKVSFVQTDNFTQDLYVNHAGETSVIPAAPADNGLNAFRLGPIGNLCQYQDPQIDALITQLGSVAPTSPQAIRTWKSLQAIIVGQALAVWVAFQPIVFATSANVTGTNLVTTYLYSVPDYHTVHLSR
jgi:peptide/nickel transport system substrate-binding protein